MGYKELITDRNGDVYLDGDWDFGTEEERDKQLRIIGTKGEHYAFSELCKGFSDWEDKERTEHRAVYELGTTGIKATLEYPDTETYKQSGWDIRIRMSNSAARYGDGYAVMMVYYDKDSGDCTGAEIYRNPMTLLGTGKLKSVAERFEFKVA